MYVITASWDSPDETPITAFDAPNDVAALMKVDDEMEAIVAKAKRYGFNAQPWGLALWNVTDEPCCVQRFDTYIEPK